MMEKCGVIYVERDLADKSERLVSVLVTEDSHIPRDQAAKRIQREMTNRSFNTPAMQFLHHSRAPLSAKTFTRQIPTAADRRRDHQNDGEPQNQTDQRMLG